MARKVIFDKSEEEILNQVPADYYQEGVKKNVFQRIWHKGKLNTVLGLIENKPENIFDIGCASGWFLSEIHKQYPGAKCTGVDKYQKAIEYGNKRYKSIKLIYADAHSLPFKNNSFDLVICTEVLEHVKDPKTVLSEIKRVLSPGGKAIVEMDTGNLFFKLVWFWWTNLRRGVWRDSHLHSFSQNKLKRMINKSGLKIDKYKVFNFTMGVAFLLEKESEKKYE